MRVLLQKYRLRLFKMFTYTMKVRQFYNGYKIFIIYHENRRVHRLFALK